MSSLTITILFASIILLTYGCPLNQQEGFKIGMKCAESVGESNPEFLMQIALHYRNPTQMANMKFICKFQPQLVDIVQCVLKEMKACIPQEVQTFMKLLPSRDRMLDGVGFICDHQETMSTHCWDGHLQSLMACSQARIMQIMQDTEKEAALADPAGLMCKIIRSDENCLQENKGSCKKVVVDLSIEALEKFFPTSKCPLNDSSKANDKMSILLGSLLTRGQPNLKLHQVQQQIPYVIQN